VFEPVILFFLFLNGKAFSTKDFSDLRGDSVTESHPLDLLED
jgi:hypothetical protein